MDGKKKTRLTLDSSFILRVYDYFGICRNNRVPQTRRLKNIRKLSFANYKLRLHQDTRRAASTCALK